MINLCERCGSYRADKRVDPLGPDAIRPDCVHRHRLVYSPLLIVSGASGGGNRACATSQQVEAWILERIGSAD